MKWFAFASLVSFLPGLSQAQQEDVFAVRTILASVTDGEGAPVSGLGAEDFSLAERGIDRDIVEVEVDEQQTEILLMVDTSIAFYGEVQPLRQAVESFIGAVTPQNMMSLYEFGGRPNLMAGPADDAGTLLSAVGKLYARQQDASYLLDAIVETGRELEGEEREEGNPVVVVIVTGMGTEFSNNTHLRAREVGERSGAVYHVVVFDSSRATTRDFVRRAEIEGALTHLAEKTGGTFERVLSTTIIRKELERVARELGPRYRVSFLSEVSPKSDPKELTLSVAKENVRAQLIRLLPGEKQVPAER
jgi:hypothetical protein